MHPLLDRGPSDFETGCNRLKRKAYGKQCLAMTLLANHGIRKIVDAPENRAPEFLPSRLAYHLTKHFANPSLSNRRDQKTPHAKTSRERTNRRL